MTRHQDPILWGSLVAVDQLTKFVAVRTLINVSSQHCFSFLGIRFFLTLTTNRGAAWGICTHSPTFLFLLRILFITVLFILYRQTVSSEYTRTSLLLILAGACSNIIDTTIRGHVIDMLHVILWGWNYPVFNLADSYIFFGALGILFAPRNRHTA